MASTGPANFTSRNVARPAVRFQIPASPRTRVRGRHSLHGNGNLRPNRYGKGDWKRARPASTSSGQKASPPTPGRCFSLFQPRVLVSSTILQNTRCFCAAGRPRSTAAPGSSRTAPINDFRLIICKGPVMISFRRMIGVYAGCYLRPMTPFES